LKILVTGASGYLGSFLSRRLRTDGNQVALLVRSQSQLDRLRDLQGEFDVGRCDSDSEIEAYVNRVRPDVVVHTACSYGRDGESILQICDSNLRFGLVVLQALVAVQRPVTFINTGTALAPEVSAYTLTKYQFAALGRQYASQSLGQLRFINVLLQHMFGPGDTASKFTSSVIRACHRNEPELRLTAGEQLRDFIYIDDVVDAYSILLSQCTTFAPNEDIEVGSGTAPTIREFVETVHRITRSSTKLAFGAVPYRTNEAMFCRADISRMKALGWNPQFNLEAGIKRTIELEFK
jgi:CDP-paratose synthetase